MVCWSYSTNEWPAVVVRFQFTFLIYQHYKHAAVIILSIGCSTTFTVDEHFICRCFAQFVYSESCDGLCFVYLSFWTSWRAWQILGIAPLVMNPAQTFQWTRQSLQMHLGWPFQKLNPQHQLHPMSNVLLHFRNELEAAPTVRTNWSLSIPDAQRPQIPLRMLYTTSRQLPSIQVLLLLRSGLWVPALKRQSRSMWLSILKKTKTWTSSFDTRPLLGRWTPSILTQESRSRNPRLQKFHLCCSID